MAAKNIVADLIRGEKKNGDNYDIWRRKIEYLLNEQELWETLNHIMAEPEEGNTAQHCHDSDAYQRWRFKDRSARITILCCMHDNLIGVFETYPTANELWEALRQKFGTTSLAKLRGDRKSVC